MNNNNNKVSKNKIVLQIVKIVVIAVIIFLIMFGIYKLVFYIL